MPENNQMKKKVGRKTNPDKKESVSTYHRPSEIEILGGKEEMKKEIYSLFKKKIKKLKP